MSIPKDKIKNIRVGDYVLIDLSMFGEPFGYYCEVRDIIKGDKYPYKVYTGLQIKNDRSKKFGYYAVNFEDIYRCVCKCRPMYLIKPDDYEQENESYTL